MVHLQATVLSKATEYIAHLEKRNKTLSKENAALKSRIDAFEALMMARQAPNAKPNPRMRVHGPPNRLN
jgi:cell division protein FtsB